MIEWNNGYTLGIPKIDQQHRILLDLINKFIENQKDPENLHQTRLILTKLVNYCKYHFKTEETLIEIFNYGHADNHKKEHTDFTALMEKTILDYDNGTIASADHLAGFFISWILEHILIHDRNYAVHIRRNLDV
jgi:hemerythrin-like metal-binding protein